VKLLNFRGEKLGNWPAATRYSDRFMASIGERFNHADKEIFRAAEIVAADDMECFNFARLAGA
jgi:hypothetical protein